MLSRRLRQFTSGNQPKMILGDVSSGCRRFDEKWRASEQPSVGLFDQFCPKSVRGQKSALWAKVSSSTPSQCLNTFHLQHTYDSFLRKKHIPFTVLVLWFLQELVSFFIFPGWRVNVTSQSICFCFFSSQALVWWQVSLSPPNVPP